MSTGRSHIAVKRIYHICVDVYEYEEKIRVIHRCNADLKTDCNKLFQLL